MNENRKITMKDVAREAGVSLGTVSKVINNIPVQQEYQLRVDAAVEKLGYHVNRYAKALRMNKSSFVQVILPNLHNPFFAKLADCICRALAARSYEMLLMLTESDYDREQAYIYLSEEQMVSGIICLTYNPDLVIPSGIPAVSIDRNLGPDITCVSSDNYAGGEMAAKKFIENGCRHLAFIPIGSSLPNETDKRKDGFVRACTDAGIPFHCECLNDSASFSEIESFLSAHIQHGKLDYDGIFCATDLLAYQVLAFLTENRIRVPKDVQIIGYDGVRHFGDQELVCSTIVQPVEEMARVSVNLILSDSSQRIPYSIQLPVQFASGGTTLF